MQKRRFNIQTRDVGDRSGTFYRKDPLINENANRNRTEEIIIKMGSDTGASF